MGDKSLKSKQREQKQKDAAKVGTIVRADAAIPVTHRYRISIGRRLWVERVVLNKRGKIEKFDTEQLAYNRFLADSAHMRGLGIALKKDVEQVEDLVVWCVYTGHEDCAGYHE